MDTTKLTGLVLTNFPAAPQYKIAAKLTEFIESLKVRGKESVVAATVSSTTVSGAITPTTVVSAVNGGGSLFNDSGTYTFTLTTASDEVSTGMTATITWTDGSAKSGVFTITTVTDAVLGLESVSGDEPSADGHVAVATITKSVPTAIDIPSNVITIKEVYINGVLFPHTATMQNVVNNDIPTGECHIANNTLIYVNPDDLYTTETNTINLVADIYDTSITSTTLGDKYLLAAAYWITSQLYIESGENDRATYFMQQSDIMLKRIFFTAVSTWEIQTGGDF